MQKITPFLWFDDNAEEAAQFYVSVFNKAKLGTVTHYGKNAPLPSGTVMTVDFAIEGQDFTPLNGGPVYQISPAISFVVTCEIQEELDYYWEQLGTGSQGQQCGWLTDKFGVSWQIVPRCLPELLSSGDSRRISRMMQSLMTMKKLDIAALERAYHGT